MRCWRGKYAKGEKLGVGALPLQEAHARREAGRLAAARPATTTDLGAGKGGRHVQTKASSAQRFRRGTWPSLPETVRAL